MAKTSLHRVRVEFGDCDPAGIVFFPNFSRWSDAASHHFFRHCGLPAWRELAELPGCIGAPLLEVHSRFLKSATHGESIDIQTTVTEWRSKVFIQQHRLMRGSDLLCETHETRALCVQVPGGSLKSVVIPDSLRELCG